MTLHKTRNPNAPAFLPRTLSRVDWGSVRDLSNSFTRSFRRGSGGSVIGSAGRRGSRASQAGGGMSAAAAAVASSYGDGISDAHLDGSVSDRYAPSSRYDPETMSRIVDVNDLHNEDDDSESSQDTIDIINSAQRSRRRTGFIAASLAIVVLASVLIVVLVGGNNNNNTAAGRGNGANLQVGYEPTNSIMNTQEERLLEIAKQIVSACSEKQLDDDMSTCQTLCGARTCCVVDDEYNCKEDESMDCPVYAGCEALVNGDLLVNDLASMVGIKY